MYASKDEIDKKISSLSLDEFGQWTVSLQTKEQYFSGGHVNTLYVDKLSKMCNQVGLHVKKVNFGKTFYRDKDILSLERNDLMRQSYSFVVECYK